MKPTLVILLGPTGVGKTELSLRIAKWLQSPIISADSRQLYREIPIGTAAPTAAQLARVKHYLVGTLALTDYYSASRFEEEVMALLPTLFPKHPNLVLTGGSMMYIDAVCKGIDDIPTISDEVRLLYKQRLEKEGLTALLQELKVKDPQYYDFVDKNNPRRVVHGLEICHQTGRTYSSFRVKEKKQRPFRIIKIALNRDREELYSRINRRVDEMMENGMVEEARLLLPYRSLNALNTVGYKELFKFFDGEWTMEEAIERIKGNTRRYARKQLTWYKKDNDIVWFDAAETDKVFMYLVDKLTC